MGRLRSLQAVEFSNNSFGGGIPTNLSQCRNLYYLNLINNQLSGSIIPEIGSTVKLEYLGLSKNMLSPGRVLANLTNLVQISLNDCGLQGEIPESLVELPMIEWLLLYGNRLTGGVPFGLFNLSSMKVYELGSNQLHGTIPSSFTLPKLRILDLADNHFTGVLPPSLSNSSLMEILYVGDNNFTGEMIDLTPLSALEELVASHNHLKGDIHTTLSSLTNSTNLQALALRDNLVTGSLPDSIGNLSTHFSDLSIGWNQISGSIPSSIGNLVALTILTAPANNLQGLIPSSIAKYQLSRISICLNTPVAA